MSVHHNPKRSGYTELTCPPPKAVKILATARPPSTMGWKSEEMPSPQGRASEKGETWYKIPTTVVWKGPELSTLHSCTHILSKFVLDQPPTEATCKKRKCFFPSSKLTLSPLCQRVERNTGGSKGFPTWTKKCKTVTLFCMCVPPCDWGGQGGWR